MAAKKGTLAKTALKVETTYGSPVAADVLIPTKGAFGISNEPELVDDESLIGAGGLSNTEAGNETNGGPLLCPLCYGDLDTLFAAAMGTLVDIVETPPPYEWEFQVLENLLTSVTIAHYAGPQSSGDFVDEYSGCTVNGFTVRGEAGGICEVEFDIIAQNYDNDSTTNTKTTIDAADFIGKGSLTQSPRVRFSDFTLMLGDNANALTSADEVAFRSFELAYSNGMARDLFTNAGVIDQPDRDAFRSLNLTLGFTKLQSEQYKDWDIGKTELQCSLAATRTVGSDAYEMTFRLPKLKMPPFNANVDGPTLVRPELNLNAQRGMGDSATWADITEELEIYVKGQVATAVI